MILFDNDDDNNDADGLDNIPEVDDYHIDEDDDDN